MIQTFTTKELAAEFGVSERQVLNYGSAIAEVYPTLGLKFGRGSWTAEAREMMLEIKDAGGIAVWRAQGNLPEQAPQATAAIVPIIEAATLASPCDRAIALTAQFEGIAANNQTRANDLIAQVMQGASQLSEAELAAAAARGSAKGAALWAVENRAAQTTANELTAALLGKQAAAAGGNAA